LQPEGTHEGGRIFLVFHHTRNLPFFCIKLLFTVTFKRG
jgi:hypothetical protein